MQSLIPAELNAHFKAHVSQLETSVAEKRKRAFADFLAVGWPHRRLEAWKYTQFDRLRDLPLTPAGAPTLEGVADFLKTHLLKEAYHCVLVDGYYSPTLSNLPEKVRISSISELKDGSPVQKFFNTFGAPASHPFAKLNSAFMGEGTVLMVEKNTVLDKPIQLILLAKTPNVMASPRMLCMIGENASVGVLQDCISMADAPHFNNSLLEVFIQKSARLDWTDLQRTAKEAYHVNGLHVTQFHRSTFNHFQVSLGGRLAREDLQIHFAESHAECALYGSYILNEKQHGDHNVGIQHELPHCESKTYYRGILNDRAHGVFNGKVLVANVARKTTADQRNDNLLLSRMTEIDAKPELQIYADDVKCTHGATVGQLDEKALFYLQARGLSEPAARYLLMSGFVLDVFKAISSESIRDVVLAAVSKKLDLISESLN